jgi:uncharacterized repeat protein (TIGR01451 family)/fimbrial isopeptide formation D2 family protein
MTAPTDSAAPTAADHRLAARLGRILSSAGLVAVLVGSAGLLTTQVAAAAGTTYDPTVTGYPQTFDQPPVGAVPFGQAGDTVCLPSGSGFPDGATISVTIGGVSAPLAGSVRTTSATGGWTSNCQTGPGGPGSTSTGLIVTVPTTLPALANYPVTVTAGSLSATYTTNYGIVAACPGVTGMTETTIFYSGTSFPAIVGGKPFTYYFTDDAAIGQGSGVGDPPAPSQGDLYPWIVVNGVTTQLPSLDVTSLTNDAGAAVAGETPVSPIYPVDDCGGSPGYSYSSSGTPTYKNEAAITFTMPALTAQNNTVEICEPDGDGDGDCYTFNVSGPAPTLTVTKSDTPGNGVAVNAGQTITYDLAASDPSVSSTPTGAVTVTDTIPAGTTYVPKSATCGGLTGCTAQYDSTNNKVTFSWPGLSSGGSANLSFKVTVNAGLAGGTDINNTASYTNVASTCGAAATCTTNEVTNPIGEPDLVTSKVSSPVSGSTVNPGQKVSYTLTFDNSKGTAAASVSYTDDLAGVLSDASVTTAPSASNAALTVSSVSTKSDSFTVSGSVAAGASYTVTYTVTVDASLTADATLTNYLVPTGTTPPSSCATTNADCTTNPVSGISVVKTASVASVSAVGQKFTYTFAVTNSGASSLSNITIDDSQTAPSVAANLGPISCPSGSLASGATEDCTATYTVSAADLANGTIDDSATATGTPPNNTPITSAPSTASVKTADLVTSKVSSPVSGSTVNPGQKVSYTLTFDNSKGTAAASVSYTDDLAGVLSDASVTTAPSASNAALTVSSVSTKSDSFTVSGSVAAGASYTVTYTVTVDASLTADATLTNYLVPTGTTPPSSCATTNADCTTNPVSGISVVKTASVASVSAVGQKFTYTFAVTNSGASSLSNITIDDSQTAPSVAANLGPISCPSGSLASGATEDCTATYTVSAADLANGTIDDSATATGTPPNNTPITSAPSTASVKTVPNTVTTPPPVTAASVGTSTTTKVSAASVALGRSFSDAATVSSGTSAPSGSVTFSLCGPSAADATCTPSPSNTVGSGPVALTAGSNDSSDAGSASVTPTTAGVYCFAAVYTPTSGSVYAGSNDNTIGTPVSSECVDVEAPHLTVVKTSVPASGSTVAPGTAVTYTLTLTNTGNGLASGVTVVDTVPVGTDYVSATCGDVPATECSVSEHGGMVTWTGVTVPAESGSTPGTAMLSLEVVVASSDHTGQLITNVAQYTNEGTANCSSATCSTDLVTLTVLVPVVSSATSPPVVKAASSVPVPGATTVHTGEPWAGSRPYEVAVIVMGAGLMGLGMVLRRRQRRGVHRRS